MKKWQTIRWVLGGLSAGAAAAVAACPAERITTRLILVGVSAVLAGLVVNLPKDPWTPEERAAKKKIKV